MDYPINEDYQEARIAMLQDTIEHGHHKSALSDEQRPHVTKFVTQDVKLGYVTVLTFECLKVIPGDEVYPIGCQDQLTINERG